MTPTSLETLFGMRREDISTRGSIYALNNRLKLPPWFPSAVEVWKHREPPDNLSPGHAKHWPEVLDLLDKLYAEHQRRQKHD